MFKKITNINYSRLACSLFLSACLVGSNVFAMDEEERGTLTLQHMQKMSREELEEFILKQQNILKGMSEAEKEVEQILNTPLSNKVTTLIDLIKICEKENLPLSSALDQAIAGPIYNKVLGQYMQDETIRSLTIRDILRDRECPQDIARRVFRGVLSWEQEGTLIHISAFLNNKPENMNDWIVLQLTHPHLNKILFFQNSVTDLLIQKYTQITKQISFILTMGSQPIEYCLF